MNFNVSSTAASPAKKPSGFQEIEVMGRSLAVTDRKAVADGLGEVRLSGGDSLSQRFAERQVGRDCRGKGASGPMGVGSVDKLGLEQFEKSPVIQQVCRPVL